MRSAAVRSCRKTLSTATSVEPLLLSFRCVSQIFSKSVLGSILVSPGGKGPQVQIIDRSSEGKRARQVVIRYTQVLDSESQVAGTLPSTLSTISCIGRVPNQSARAPTG